ncbi:MAG: helix-turn-helix transcriptional regulator [Chloroflexi bacterium]|nr:helix-turn-helix transcriptional regulator [Chloroflexota bacterium]
MAKTSRGDLAKRTYQPKVLKSLMIMNNFNQTYVARQVSVSTTTVGRWVSETWKATPTPEHLEALAELFDVDTDTFFKPITFDFRDLFETNMKSFMQAAIQADNTAERRLALEMYKHLFPNPVEEDEYDPDIEEKNDELNEVMDG